MAELSKEEFDALVDDIKREKRERAEKMPTVRDALVRACEAYQRLQELGFRPIIYGPRDGSEVEVVEFGSTGVFVAHYQKLTDGHVWWIQDAGDLWPSHPVMFRRGPFVDSPHVAPPSEQSSTGGENG